MTDIKVSLPEFHSCSLGTAVKEASEGAVLARFESDFRTSAEELLSLNELLDLLGTAAEKNGRSREDAIACYLSGGEGWREAMKLLGGTFAEEETGLKDRKKD